MDVERAVRLVRKDSPVSLLGNKTGIVRVLRRKGTRDKILLHCCQCESCFPASEQIRPFKFSGEWPLKMTIRVI